MKKIGVIILLSMLITTISFSYNIDEIDSMIDNTAEYILETTSTPIVGSVGGEWAVIGLGRSEYNVPASYYSGYYNRIVDYVKEKKGVLHEKKYTEYSRIILSLTTMGKDPRDVGGYDLLVPLGDYEKTIWQGINGPIWALIALDSNNYEMPVNEEAKIQATRMMYVDRILACQLEDGGFSLFGGTEYETASDQYADPDITGMALQALAKYQYRDDVKKVTEEALIALSELQNKNGGYSSWGSENSESCVQVIVALCELGIPLDDSRFVKNGHTLIDNLSTYYRMNDGFLHTSDGSGVNMMATEQAFYGLVAAKRSENNMNSLYRMTDVGPVDTVDIEESMNKHKDINVLDVLYPGKTFEDIKGLESSHAIESLAARGIISGKTVDKFGPESTVSRGEFACMIVKALGLQIKGEKSFDDVPSVSWYEPYIRTAYAYGIIKGRDDNHFDPDGVIKVEEAAVMVWKAAKLAGMDEKLENSQIRDILAPFVDYMSVSTWARESVAFCFKYKMLDDELIYIEPKLAIERSRIASMIYEMLKASQLIK